MISGYRRGRVGVTKVGGEERAVVGRMKVMPLDWT